MRKVEPPQPWKEINRKKDTVKSKAIWQIFVSGSTEKQVGYHGKTVVIDRFSEKKAE